MQSKLFAQKENGKGVRPKGLIPNGLYIVPNVVQL